MRFVDSVLEELERLEYPELVLEYAPEDVARSTARTIEMCYKLHISPRMTAIIIWLLTMEMQIIASSREMVKH